MTDAARPPLSAETILALPAGPDLDAWVAKRCFGCKVLALRGLFPYGCGCPDGRHVASERDGITPELKQYSTSWEAMGELVARLRAENDHVEIQFERGSPCCCDVRRHTYQGPEWSALAADAPEAVAKAALLSTLEKA